MPAASIEENCWPKPKQRSSAPRAYTRNTRSKRAALGVASPALAAESKGKVVIFGGSGYVGAFASQLLLAQGYSVVSVSRKSPSEQPK